MSDTGIGPRGRAQGRDGLHHGLLGRDDELEWIVGLLREHGVAQQCRERAAIHLDRAIAALDVLPSGASRETLSALALELGQRKF